MKKHVPSHTHQGAAKPVGRRQRRRTETEERILGAAMRLFEEHGFANTTVEQITEAADVGKGTFFNYFETKEQVLFTLFARFQQAFEEARVAAASADDVRAFLSEFTLHVSHQPVRTPALMRNVLGICMSHETVAPQFQKMLRTARQFLTTLIERGQRLAQVRDDVPAAELARNYQQFILGTEVLWALESSADLNQRVISMCTMFWEGAMPRGSTRRSARGKE